MGPFHRHERDAADGGGVLGSRLGEAKGWLLRRRVPRGGLREEGLTLDKATIEGGPPSSEPRSGSRPIRVVIVVAAVLVAVLVVGLVAVSMLARTSAFTIEGIDTQATEHLSAENIARLAKVERGATLLNIDTDAVEENLRKNPWVASASISREFPDRLRIEVTERSVGYVVVMSSGTVAWYLGEDNVWIEPLKIDTEDNTSITDAALGMADALGAVLITDVPYSVSPVAGSESTDESIAAVRSFQEQFSQDFSSEVASYSVADVDSVSCMLRSGIEVSLGSVSNVDAKEAVIKAIAEEYEGQVTYINVRVPSRPSYRTVGSDDVEQGTGTSGSALDTESEFSDNVPDSTMLTEEEIAAATQPVTSNSNTNSNTNASSDEASSNENAGDGDATSDEEQDSGDTDEEGSDSSSSYPD